MSFKRKTTLTKYDPYVDEALQVPDDYEYYEALYTPGGNGRRIRYRSKPAAKPPVRRSQEEVVSELADAIVLEGGFRTTYKPGRHEAEWLLDSLRVFYDESLILDVLGQVKGGKEASVYRCEAHPSVGVPYLAAKVYRPRRFRTMRNDARYRRGRQILTGEGRAAKTTDHRIMRAIGKKSKFGVQVMHTSWLMHEYVAMERLYQAGGSVPQTVASSENAILMGYYGDEVRGAPTLNEVSLDPDEALELFGEVCRNIELMLAHDMIHGDLSAYNILYWEGSVVVIDFPQVIETSTNEDAYGILGRDVQRVCDYFKKQGVRRDPAALLDELWARYVENEWTAMARAADLSLREQAREEHELLLGGGRI
jgi:RIO kinase 1